MVAGLDSRVSCGFSSVPDPAARNPGRRPDPACRPGPCRSGESAMRPPPPDGTRIAGKRHRAAIRAHRQQRRKRRSADRHTRSCFRPATTRDRRPGPSRGAPASPPSTGIMNSPGPAHRCRRSRSISRRATTRTCRVHQRSRRATDGRRRPQTRREMQFALRSLSTTATRSPCRRHRRRLEQRAVRALPDFERPFRPGSRHSPSPGPLDDR